jgi:hypothetical protein
MSQQLILFRDRTIFSAASQPDDLNDLFALIVIQKFVDISLKVFKSRADQRRTEWYLNGHRIILNWDCGQPFTKKQASLSVVVIAPMGNRR